MKKLLSVLLCSTTLTIQAQMPSTVPSEKVWKITDAFFGVGGYSSPDFAVSQTQMNQLAPGSELMKRDISGFVRSDYGDAFGGAMLTGSLGLRRTDLSDPSGANGPLLRFGFNYSSAILLGSTWSRSLSARFDTLTSSATGEQVFVDTVYREYLSGRYEAQRMQLDASILYFTKTNTRVKLYGGAGASAGFTMQPNTRIFYSVNTNDISDPVANGLYDYDGFRLNNTVKQEWFDNRSSWTAALYVPLGFDFCLGKQRPFWKMLHLQYELRPGLAMLSVPEIRTYTHVFLQQGLTLRVNWASAWVTGERDRAI